MSPLARRLIATVSAIAAALALMTAAAALPARAGDNDLAKAVAAIAAIALIAKAAEDQRRKKARHPGHPHGHPPRHAILLPESCAIDFPSREGWTRVHSGPCLDRHGYRGLPASCETSVRVQGQVIPVYDGRCLARAGYLAD